MAYRGLIVKHASLKEASHILDTPAVILKTKNNNRKNAFKIIQTSSIRLDFDII